MVSVSKKRDRSLSPEDDKEEDEKPHRKKLDVNKETEQEPEEEEEDDSDETLALLRRSAFPVTPPEKMVQTGLLGLCSKPIRMQLTKKDVNFQEKQSKLVLSKSKLTKEFDVFVGGKEWMVVSVYGPDGRVHEMKMWIDEKENKIDLKKGWSKFVGDYELKEICDFVTVWMFWNRERRDVSLAIDTIRLGVRKQLSKRISKAVFDDDDSD